MKNEDDILEDALNSGVAFTANKYSLTKDEVIKIVMKFKIDIDGLCSCDKERIRGQAMFCSMCDRDKNRIKL